MGVGALGGIPSQAARADVILLAGPGADGFGFDDLCAVGGSLVEHHLGVFADVGAGGEDAGVAGDAVENFGAGVVDFALDVEMGIGVASGGWGQIFRGVGRAKFLRHSSTGSVGRKRGRNFSWYAIHRHRSFRSAQKCRFFTNTLSNDCPVIFSIIFPSVIMLRSE